ncbi:DUF6059 family protein [Streptomyces sp. NPDC088766]|uniref:DUF6059 family protein n=1 Tax=Streptomyces sp. NPDC088766 TaxID=3365893 RepID=UPI00380DFE52
MAGLIRRFLHGVYEALQAYGAIYVSGARLPGGRPPPEEGLEGPVRLEGPPTAHPERLCPDVALSAVERALERELDGGS